MSNAPGRPKSWKGNDAEAVFEPARHRWQAGTGSLERSLIKAQERSVRWRLLLLAMLSLGMLAAFVAILLWGPSKTPLISVAATSYAWPLPPNAWAYEDNNGLAVLNDKNIDWRDASAAWQSSKQALDDLRLQIDVAEPLARRAGALVIVLSMHGAVDDNQHPCLLPTGSSSLAPEQWIRLGDILAMLPKPSSGLHTLLVLDCIDEQVNWNAGVVQSTFAERVIDWIKEQDAEHYSVLLSAAPQQCAWSGPELQSSIFGKELRLALCGAADDPTRNTPDQATSKSPYPYVHTISQGGNEDGVVSLHELTNYVQHQVRDWVLVHRQQEQTPLLISKRNSDVPLVRALSQSELRRLEASQDNNQLAAAKPSIDEMAGLWRMLDQLRQRDSFRFEPRAWADLEHQLLWLEKLANSGRAYTDQASLSLYPDLSKRLQQALERAAGLDVKDSLIARSKILTNVPVWRLDDASLSSLAWIDLALEQPPCDTSVLRAQLVEALAPGSTQDIDGLLTSHGLSNQSPLPNEINFAALVRKSECGPLWSDQSSISQVIELRDQCEKLAVLGDVRAHRLRRQSLQSLDVVRRELEDGLFVGQKPNDDRFKQRLSAALDLANKTTAIEQSIERTLAIRDRGLAEVPYLTAWVCAPGTDMSNLGDWLAKDGANPLLPAAASEPMGQNKIDPQLRERIARQRLQRLIDNLKTLGDVLQQTPSDGLSDVSKPTGVADEVARDLETMRYLMQDHVQRSLSSVPSNSANIVQIQELLELPMIPANDRLALHKKLEEHFLYKSDEQAKSNPTAVWIDQVQKQVTGRSAASQPAVDEPPRFQSTMARYNFRMQQWATHPVASLLGLEPSKFSLNMTEDAGSDKSTSIPESQQIDLLNETLRTYYLAVASFDARQLTAWANDSALDLDAQALAEEWSRVAAAANIERRLLPICPVRPENDASALFIGTALKDQLLWYARRTLKDFYADGQGPVNSPTTSHYFDTTIERLLQTAALLPSLEGDDKQEKELRRQLEILRTLARSGLRSSAKAGIPSPATKQVGYEIGLQPTFTMPPESGPDSPWPTGLAAAWLRDDQGPISDERQTITVPVAQGGANVTLYTDSMKRDATNEAVVWFRGHTYRAPLFVGQGIVVDYRPNQFDWAQVVLFGDRVQQPSIVFIVDCSWSMGEALPVESMDTSTQSRLELAKSHVLKLMEELALAEDARLGVRLFGHRLGWSRPVDPKTGLAKGSSQVIPQPNYPRSIPEDVVPSRDVEAIVPLGRFTPEMIGPLSKTLATIVPWGQSPLYLSITEAFKDFGADNQSTTKSIVVITDGDNFQFNATRRPGGDGGAQTTLDDVLAAWQAAKVPLYILGVGVDGAADAKDGKARSTLKSLAERTGGKYYDIESGGDLLRALAEQTSTATYEVRRADSKANGPASQSTGESNLNETVDLQKVTGNDKYQLTFQAITKDFTVDGGESLEMVVADDGQDIIAQPYEVQSPKSGVLIRSGQPSLTVRVHRPQFQDNGVLFPISFQSPRQHYTPRPKETWIEVSPVSPDGQAMRRTYIYYDTNYDAKTPVPRQSWLASDWPPNSTSADVRVWARYDRAPVNTAIPLSELRNNAEQWATGAPISGLPETTLRMVGQPGNGGKSWVLHVTEIHSPKSRGVGSLRIGIDNGRQALPTRITRRFDTESRIALHSFEFDSAVSERILAADGGKLTITTRENVLDQSYQLDGGAPIRVDFVRSLDLLPLPTPATTSR